MEKDVVNVLKEMIKTKEHVLKRYLVDSESDYMKGTIHGLKLVLDMLTDSTILCELISIYCNKDGE